MNINWNEIKEKYPKAYNKFITENNLVEDRTVGKLKLLKDCINVDNGYDISEASYICYCDLEKFFDNNGIIINIFYNQIDRRLLKNDFIYCIYKIRSKKYKKLYSSRIAFKTRDKAKEKSIPKAFEILEERLNGKENIRSENI